MLQKKEYDDLMDIDDNANHKKIKYLVKNTKLIIIKSIKLKKH